MNKNLLIPLGVFLLLVVFLGLGFQLRDPHFLPSELIDRPFPEFELVDLHDGSVVRSRRDLVGEISLVNVWATWCPNCVIEHPELVRIAAEEGVPIYGVNYNDDTPKAIAWLQRRKDPYQFSLVDDEGRLAIDLGVYGAPETFVLDEKGVIQYRHVGTVTNEVWRQDLLPVIVHLRGRREG